MFTLALNRFRFSDLSINTSHLKKEVTRLLCNIIASICISQNTLSSHCRGILYNVKIHKRREREECPCVAALRRNFVQTGDINLRFISFTTHIIYDQ